MDPQFRADEAMRKRCHAWVDAIFDNRTEPIDHAGSIGFPKYAYRTSMVAEFLKRFAEVAPPEKHE